MPAIDLKSLVQTEMSEAMATQVEVVPEDEYVAQIRAGSIEFASGQYSKGDRQGETFYRLVGTFDIITEDDSLEKELGRKPTVPLSLMVDVDEERGSLAAGKGVNVGLGQLREACGQNDPTQGWMPSMLECVPIHISVKHRSGDDGRIWTDVKGFRPL